MTEGNGEFKGSTLTRLERIETDIRDMKVVLTSVKTNQDRWLGVIGTGAVLLPIIIRVLFP